MLTRGWYIFPPRNMLQITVFACLAVLLAGIHGYIFIAGSCAGDQRHRQQEDIME